MIAPFLLSASPAPDICGVLEVAYAAAIESRVPASPVDVQPSWRELALEKFVPDFIARTTLSKGEVADLVAHQGMHREKGFRALCLWQARPMPAKDYEGHQMKVSFSSPIFSGDMRLAVVEVSFQEPGFGYGSFCVLRGGRGAWSAQCHPDWIT
ncbi:hypothetical protein Q9Q95_02070 [Sphingomonas sp. DG1-23]|uniref:hypothetical protein n=1 Tax=Sphingomonas sp. DG1-23 TaxID=3068316 RepID=UPI00273E5EDA|nr:hypothetical protein [Sphingomonas sp. DG1-23]MDP5277697.1 hypothetical protein [Sphingomonas sp. DG1-23]